MFRSRGLTAAAGAKMVIRGLGCNKVSSRQYQPVVGYAVCGKRDSINKGGVQQRRQANIKEWITISTW